MAQKRYLSNGKEGLKDISRRPHNSSFRLDEEEKIVSLRKQTNFGARRLKVEFNLPYSSRTIHKIFQQEGLVCKRVRRHHKKQDLRDENAKRYQPLEYYQMEM